MIDTQELVDFGKEYALVLDAFEQFKGLEPPTGAEGAQGLERWFREFEQIWLTITVAPEPERLARFAEELDEVLARIGGTDAPPPPAEEEALLPTVIPDGDADNEMLRWDETTTKAWAILDGPDTDFKVLQRLADDSLGFDWVRAH